MIIQLNAQYRLSSDPLNVVSEEKTIAEKGMNAGQEVWKKQGYYPNLQSAVKGCLNRDIMARNLRGVTEVIDRLDELEEKIIETLKERETR